MVRITLIITSILLSLVPNASAQEDPGSSLQTPQRPTIERRFAPKAKLLYGQLTAMTHMRDDFYNTWGVGADVGYFLVEWLSLEVRYITLNNSLDASAIDLKERLGLTPDAYAQNDWILGGVRWAPGYGKMLMWNAVVMHFDPQFVFHAGVARAQDRLLTTMTGAFSLMTHWRWGIKATLDLGLSVQQEERDRGNVWTLGFAPVLGIGWGWNL